jgi:[ribosomal protein S18]-alanine N-acetyltransferase
MNLAVRPMQHADLDAVRTLVALSPEAPQWPPSAYAPYLTHDSNLGLLRTALVAIASRDRPHEGKVLAFASATLLLDGEQNLCQLDSIAVHPDHRRHGLGAALLRDLVFWAARNNAHHFSLEVRASNAPALALYHRLGLRQEGRRPRYYTDPEEDALLWGIPITPASPPDVFHVKNG